MLKINEFRTSIIESKSHKKWENLIKKHNYEKMNIKSVYTLEKIKEKIKEKNIKKYRKLMEKIKIHKILTCFTSEKFIKYINRYINATKIWY